MKKFKLILINFVVLICFISVIEAIFGYWFKENNFGIYMRKERRINWFTEVNINNQNYKFFYKRNFWGFRGVEFNPQDIKVIFQGGSTGNQRMHPEKLTIVGQLNNLLRKDQMDLKIYNSSTDGKSTHGYINDFLYWFPKIPNLKPDYMIFYMGINDTFRNSDKHWDYKVSENKVDKVKDYIKNNSIFVDKYKVFKNKFFPRNILAYEPESNNLYENFKYKNFRKANSENKNLNSEEEIVVKRFKKALVELDRIIVKKDLIPIFITQVMFNGLENRVLFTINNELKIFAQLNNYYIIPLDELVEMDVNDFYDPVHTTPQGSRKIANTLYPFLKKILFSKN